MNVPETFETILSTFAQDYIYMALLLLISMGLTTLWALRVASSEWEAKEAALQRYHTLLEQVSDGVVTISLKGGTLLSANRQAAELSGYTPEELKKLTSDYLFPSDADRWIEKASQLGRGNFTNVTLRRGSGEAEYINVDATTVTEDGHKALQVAFHPLQGIPRHSAPSRPTVVGRRQTQPQRSLPTASVSHRSPVPALRPLTLQRQDTPPAAARFLPVERIMHLVAESFGVKTEDLSRGVNSPRLTMARRVVMYLATQVAAIAPEDTGRALNDRSQVAVLYGARLISDLLDQEPGMRQQIERLQAQVLAGAPIH